MSGRISKLEEFEFEEWIRNNYPDLFKEWELDASDFMDLDCWIYESYSMVFREWQHAKSLFPQRPSRHD